MRIIGQISHPYLKISVFKNEGRVSVKFENEGYETTYKFGDDAQFSEIKTLENLFDETFLETVLQTMRMMHQNKIKAINRIHPAPEEVFEEII